jgi:hypothetical protein
MMGAATTWRAVVLELHAVIGTVAAQAASHGHKQGRVAVIVSVLGLVVIIALIVFLASMSLRRRLRDQPPEKKPGDRGPRQPRRGLFG